MSEWQIPTPRLATQHLVVGDGRGRQVRDVCAALLGVLESLHVSSSGTGPRQRALTRTLTWSPVGDRRVSKPFATMSSMAIWALTTLSTGRRPRATRPMIRGQSVTG